MRTFWLLVACSVSVWAASPSEGQAPATLRWFNRDVVTLRAPLLGSSPAERVETARGQLKVALEQGAGLQVSVTPNDLGRAVLLNGRLLFFLQEADLDPAAGLSLDEAAAQVAEGLRVTLTLSREQRSSESLTQSLLSLGIATLVFVVATALLWWLRARVLSWLAALLGARKEHLRLGTLRLVRWTTIGLVLEWAVRLSVGAVVLASLVQWLAFGLSQFLYTRPWGERLQGFIASTLIDGLIKLVEVVPDLLVVGFIAWLTWASMRLSGALFRQVEAGRWTTSWLTPATAGVTRKLLSVALVLFGLVMAYPYLPGSGTEAFKGLSVLLGVMVSLGASSTVGQAASGLILIYTNAFSVGDQVRIGEAAGRVTVIGMFTTRLVTHQGEELVLPNSAILGATVRNFTRRGERALLELVVTIGYDVSWRQVEALLLEGAGRTSAVVRDPLPRVVVGSLDDFFVTYRLVAFSTDDRPRETVQTELNRHVLDAFNEAKVQIMSPHYFADPSTPKLAPAGDVQG